MSAGLADSATNPLAARACPSCFKGCFRRIARQPGMIFKNAYLLKKSRRRPMLAHRSIQQSKAPQSTADSFRMLCHGGSPRVCVFLLNLQLPICHGHPHGYASIFAKASPHPWSDSCFTVANRLQDIVYPLGTI